MDDLVELTRLLRVLGVAKRLEILQLLKGRALCVNALVARLGVTQGAVSQHLRVLRNAGLVIDERRGCYVHYRLDEATLAAWREGINALLDPGLRADPTMTSAEMCGCGGADQPCRMAGTAQTAARHGPAERPGTCRGPSGGGAHGSEACNQRGQPV